MAIVTIRVSGTVDRDAAEWGRLVASCVQRDLRENGVSDAVALVEVDDVTALRIALHGLVSKLMASADEIDADGDICCALTRRHDAVDILAVLGEARENAAWCGKCHSLGPIGPCDEHGPFGGGR